MKPHDSSITFFLSLVLHALYVFVNVSTEAFTLQSTYITARHIREHPLFTRDSKSIKPPHGGTLPIETVFGGANRQSNYATDYDRLYTTERKMSLNDVEDKIDRTYDNLGPLMPLAEKLDEVSGDWALSYADLSPVTPKTPTGVLFLATNIGYAGVGLALGLQGEYLLGILTEIAGIVSFWYHYSQLEFGQDRSEVRLALLTDYITASSALITGGFYIAQIGISSLPLEIFGFGGAGILCLGLCWVWEYGYPYLVLHSLWHIFSAYSAYLVGQAHLMASP